SSEPDTAAEPLRLVTAPAASADPSAEKKAGTRPLRTSEVELLKKVFGPGLKYPVVRLTRMSALVATLNGSRAFTLSNTIHLPAKAYNAMAQYPSLLVHEMVHVWQYQREGWSYAPDALWAQVGGDGYDFAKALRQGKSWKKMNPEQQAQMIQEAFRGVYFDTPGALFGLLHNKTCIVRPSATPPEGFADYTSVLVDAVALLRKPA
ncbi:MAG TPA: DUF4157 domain-containing protein, partial [Myxococcaceae bacterium]